MKNIKLGIDNTKVGNYNESNTDLDFIILKSKEEDDKLVELDSEGSFIFHTEKVKKLVEEHSKLKAENERLKEIIEWCDKTQKKYYGNATGLHIEMLDLPDKLQAIKENHE